MYIPCYANIELNVLEYYKLIQEYSEMILEVDGNNSFELPSISNKLIELSKNIDLELIVNKLSQSGKKSTSDVKTTINPPDSSRSQSMASVRSDARSGDISPEEK